MMVIGSGARNTVSAPPVSQRWVWGVRAGPGRRRIRPIERKLLRQPTPATPCSMDASRYRRLPAHGPIAPLPARGHAAMRCARSLLFSFTVWIRRGGTPLAVGVQVTVCTPIPPPWITRHVIVGSGLCQRPRAPSQMSCAILRSSLHETRSGSRPWAGAIWTPHGVTPIGIGTR